MDGPWAFLAHIMTVSVHETRQGSSNLATSLKKQPIPGSNPKSKAQPLRRRKWSVEHKP